MANECPKCQTSNADDSKFCKACGANISTTDKIQPSFTRTFETPVEMEQGTIIADHYEILEKLGQGGMGEVYKAKDIKLGRPVAVKVLRKELAANTDRLKRFEQEARAASALDHPNIVTVFDIVEFENMHFIVMQYIEGRTLRELIGSRTFRLDDALNYAIQIADGLAKAHSSNIIHRDLKPDNIMVTAEGTIKILDFGLAKLMETSDISLMSKREMEHPQTKEGFLVGTIPYMSPEQAQGKPVDSQSDIFSFGSVLYEMITGQRPFLEDSMALLLAAIVQKEPKKVSQLVTSVPIDLEKLITRTLRKEPKRRFHSMDDVRIELQDIKEELESGSTISANQVIRKGTKKRKERWFWYAAGTALVIFAAVIVWQLLLSSRPTTPPPRTIPLTTYPGGEYQPAISPDGSQVAFARQGDNGMREFYIKLIDRGEPLMINRDSSNTGGPRWSPDGNQIAFLRFVRDDSGNRVRGIFVIPALGGTERQIATTNTRFGTGGPAWSPDGKHLAFTDRESSQDSNGIFLLSLETGEKRRLTSPPSEYRGDHYPRFSPDGQMLAFVRMQGSFQSDIYLVPLEGGNPLRLTFDNYMTPGLDWTPDGKSIIFAAVRSGRVGYWSLWRIPASGGEPLPLEVGEQGAHPSLSRQGRCLVYEKRNARADIWRCSGPSALPDDKTSEPFITSTSYSNSPEYSPGGQKIIFGSGRSGFQEIWICESDGTSPRQLTFLEHQLTGFGSWSPDGKQIAFQSLKKGNYDIYIVNVAGGFPRQLTTWDSDEHSPTWSRDGRWIYHSSNRTGRPELYKISVDGGDAVKLTENGGARGFESPDGRYFYFTKNSIDGGQRGIWQMPLNGGEENQILDQGEYLMWEVTEQGIYLVNRTAAPAVVLFYSFTTGELSQITALEKPPTGLGFSISPDSKWILYQVIENEYDIMLVENFH